MTPAQRVSGKPTAPETEPLSKDQPPPDARSASDAQPMGLSGRRLRRRPRAITLDLDDTLWPMLPVLRGAERALGDWLSLNAPATARYLDVETRMTLRQAVMADHPERAHDVGFLRLELLRRALRTAGESPFLAEPAFEAFMNARQQVTLYEDVLPILSAWSSQMPLVAVTNGNADLRRIGLADYFVGIVSAHEIGCAKPDPRVFHAACRIAGVEPAETLHVGDDLRLDVEGAIAAGMQAVWLLRADLADKHEVKPHDPSPAEDLYAIDSELRDQR